MTDRALKTAVVGVGHLGRIHAQIYADNPGAELAYVVDTNRSQASELAEKLGCTAIPDSRELPDDIEAVSIAVPTIHHAAVAVPLLERGIACLVEKPLAPNLEQAEASVPGVSGLLSRCWGRDVSTRPTAAECFHALSKLHAK